MLDAAGATWEIQDSLTMFIELLLRKNLREEISASEKPYFAAQQQEADSRNDAFNEHAWPRNGDGDADRRQKDAVSS